MREAIRRRCRSTPAWCGVRGSRARHLRAARSPTSRRRSRRPGTVRRHGSAWPGWSAPASGRCRPRRALRGRRPRRRCRIWPIIHSRPMVGVANRVRTIDGMPTMNVSTMPPIPASSASHDGRNVVPGNGSKRNRLATATRKMPDPGPEAGDAHLHVDGEGEHRHHDHGERPRAGRQHRQRRCRRARCTPRRPRRRGRRRP